MEHIPSGSSILSEYGFFNTIISHIIKAEKSFVDDMYAKNLNVENGNFRFEITSGIIKVSYNGNTVFQIDPSSGNVFFGKPNSILNAPLSGFMYKASDGSIVSKDNKVVINSNGEIIATNGSFSGNINATSGSFRGRIDATYGNFSGSLNSASGSFTGSFVTPSLESRPKTSPTVSASVVLSSPSLTQCQQMVSLPIKNNVITNASHSADPNVKYIKANEEPSDYFTSYNFYLYGAKLNLLYKMYYYDQNKGSDYYESTIPAGTLTLGTSGDVLIFNVDNIPYSSTDLEVGQIYRDSSNRLYIKT